MVLTVNFSLASFTPFSQTNGIKKNVWSEKTDHLSTLVDSGWHERLLTYVYKEREPDRQHVFLYQKCCASFLEFALSIQTHFLAYSCNRLLSVHFCGKQYPGALRG